MLYSNYFNTTLTTTLRKKLIEVNSYLNTGNLIIVLKQKYYIQPNEYFIDSIIFVSKNSFISRI